MPLKDKRSWKFAKCLTHLSIDAGCIIFGATFMVTSPVLPYKLVGIAILFMGLALFRMDIKTLEEI